MEAELGLEELAGGGSRDALCPALGTAREGWASSGVTLGASPALGWDRDPVPVLWMGWRSFVLMMGSVMLVPWAANKPHQTPGASRCSQVHLHFRASRPNFLEKVRFRCLTDCGTTVPDAKLSARPRACNSPLDLVRDHGSISPNPPNPAAAFGQARCIAAGTGCFRHGVCRGKTVPPCPPRPVRRGNCC